MNNKEIGNRIKSRRLELNLTLKEIADFVGVASSTIQRYESGYINQYKMPVLQSIAYALKVNPTWLVREDAPKEMVSQEKVANKGYFKVITTKEDDLLALYNKLNELGKDEALKRVSELTEINKYTSNDLEFNTIAAHDDDLTEEEKENSFAAALECIKKHNK